MLRTTEYPSHKGLTLKALTLLVLTNFQGLGLFVDSIKHLEHKIAQSQTQFERVTRNV